MPCARIAQYWMARSSASVRTAGTGYDLLFRREWPYFLAFDVLFIDGVDRRGLPLSARKQRPARIMPRIESRMMLLEPIPCRGRRLFEPRL
jgi:hypothetical protein